MLIPIKPVACRSRRNTLRTLERASAGWMRSRASLRVQRLRASERNLCGRFG
jgi:hypothetical protein